MSGKPHIHIQAVIASRVFASLFYSLVRLSYFPPQSPQKCCVFFPSLQSNVFTPLLTELFFPSQHFPICPFCLSLSLLPSVLLSSRLSSHQECKVSQPWVTTHDPFWHSHGPCSTTWAKTYGNSTRCCVFDKNRGMEDGSVRGRLRNTENLDEYECNLR